MNCGIFIVARLGSQRLRAKHLQLAAGSPVLLHLIRRVRHAFAGPIKVRQAKVVVVTSDEADNRALIDVVGSEAEVFFGSIHNIPLRQWQAAQAGAFNEVISVDGDDILCSPEGMVAVAEKLSEGAVYAQTAGLPFGMNSFGYSSAFLGEAVGPNQGNTLETGWGRIFSSRKPETIAYQHLPSDERLRFTLDYPADLKLFQAIFEALGSRAATAKDEEIVRLVLDREIYRHNASLAEEYWANFRRQVEKEKTTNT